MEISGEIMSDTCKACKHLFYPCRTFVHCSFFIICKGLETSVFALLELSEKVSDGHTSVSSSHSLCSGASLLQERAEILETEISKPGQKQAKASYLCGWMQREERKYVLLYFFFEELTF